LLITPLYSQSSQSESDIYKEFELNQNSPNPFTDVTSIKFELLRPGNVTLNVYDADGRMLETLVEGDLEPSKYNVYFTAFEGLLPGEYYYKLETKDSKEIKKMNLYRY